MLRNGAFSPVSAEKQGGTPPRFTLWGVVNVTPDSFFDGGEHASLESALAHALKLASDGARILDLGGASSRPGAEDVPEDEETSRVLPLVKELAKLREQARRAPEANSALPAETLISVDTWRAGTARAALEAGADILNDISACAWDPALRETAAALKPGYVLMHCMPGTRPGTMQDAPRYGDVVDEVLRFFEENMALMVKAGLPESHIMLDPGIGFGKTAEHNCALLAGMERLNSLGRPILLGVSNKSLFGHLLGLGVAERGE
ncbi:MAG: dihydropteroate synthase, partial [Mailhella sp.]|nr:dihydropteroate synthase [Mailhella sp.]